MQPLKLVTIIAAGGFLGGLFLALIYAPTDPVQGEVQRIFYLHLASFGGAFTGFVAAALGGLAYLRTRQPIWDRLGLAGVEVGLALAAINISTGAIYARPIVNAWWTWDPKLTAVTIMALTYAAYLMLRNAVEHGERRRVFSAIYSLFAFVTVIYTFLSIRLRSDVLHDVMFEPGSGLFGMPEAMQLALFGNLFVWGLLIAPVLIVWRMRLERLREETARRLITAMEN